MNAFGTRARRMYYFSFMLNVLAIALVAGCGAQGNMASDVTSEPTAGAIMSTRTPQAWTSTPEPTSTSGSTQTPEPTSTSEPTPTIIPTATPELVLGDTRVNTETGVTELCVGDGRFLETPAHYKSEYLIEGENGQVYYDAPGLHLFVNESGEWQVRPFEEVDMNGFEVMYGAGGQYAITSDTAKAEERMRDFFVSWVLSAGNVDYRQQVLGSRSVGDDQAWEFLQENGLPITEQLKTPHADTNILMLQLTRFAGNNLGYTVIPVDQLGMILIMEDDWNNDRYGIKTAVEAMDSASGRLDVKFTPLQLKLDNKGRIYVLIVNKGVPIEDGGYPQREFYTEDIVFGGHTSEAQPEDPFIITSQFETMVNILKMWQPSHTDEYWLYEFRGSLEEFNRVGNAQGSYGAYSNQIEELYDSSYLIGPVH